MRSIFTRLTFDQSTRSDLSIGIELWLGAASDVVDYEARAMAQIRIGATASRRVLGSLNDLASLARFTIEGHPDIDLGKVAIELAETPCAPLNYESPRSVSLALLRRVNS